MTETGLPLRLTISGPALAFMIVDPPICSTRSPFRRERRNQLAAATAPQKIAAETAATTAERARSSLATRQPYFGAGRAISF